MMEGTNNRSQYFPEHTEAPCVTGVILEGVGRLRIDGIPGIDREESQRKRHRALVKEVPLAETNFGY